MFRHFLLENICKQIIFQTVLTAKNDQRFSTTSCSGSAMVNLKNSLRNLETKTHFFKLKELFYQTEFIIFNRNKHKIWILKKCFSIKQTEPKRPKTTKNEYILGSGSGILYVPTYPWGILVTKDANDCEGGQQLMGACTKYVKA